MPTAANAPKAKLRANRVGSTWGFDVGDPSISWAAVSGASRSLLYRVRHDGIVRQFETTQTRFTDTSVDVQSMNVHPSQGRHVSVPYQSELAVDARSVDSYGRRRW